MKNLSLVFNVVLLIAVAGLYYLQFSGSSGSETPKKSDSEKKEVSSSPLDRSIVYINTDTLWEKYEYVEDMKQELFEEKQKLERQYESALREFQEDYQFIQERAAYLSERQLAIEQENLMKKEQEMLALKEQLSMKLMESEADKNKRIQTAIEQVIESYNMDQKHVLILGKSVASDLLWAEDDLDITKMIVERLNEDYRKESTQKDSTP